MPMSLDPIEPLKTIEDIGKDVNIDVFSLLCRYMGHVYSMEGATFVHSFDKKDFSEEEQDLLFAIEEVVTQ